MVKGSGKNKFWSGKSQGILFQTKSGHPEWFVIFSPKTNLMFRVGFKEYRLGMKTGTTHTFYLSLNMAS